MNPFAQMTSMLTSQPTHATARDLTVLKSSFVTGTGCCGARRNGNTDKLRAVLQCGPATAKQLADTCGLKSSGVVMALLRHDVRKGLVVLRDGVYVRVPAC